MRILLVEDDRELAEIVRFSLEKEGYAVDVCHSGGDAMHYIKQQACHLVLLDRMLPEQSGIEILARMRSAGIQTPVIMTTALNGIGDRITGLDSGADDYLVKPYAIDELLARIRAVARRPAKLESRTISFSDLSLDVTGSVLTGPNGVQVLARREADLMAVFLQNPARVLPRGALFARVWGPDAPVEDGNLDNYIHFLRRRLRTIGSRTAIKTIRAVGYALEGGVEC